MAANTSHQHPQEQEQLRNEISYDEISNGSGIPVSVWKAQTDLRLWDQEVDITQEVTQTQATTYFAQSMIEAIWFNYKGKTLRESFREEFEGWTAYQFDMVARAFRKRMLQLLEEDTVIPGSSMSARLARVLDREIPESRASSLARQSENRPEIAVHTPEPTQRLIPENITRTPATVRVSREVPQGYRTTREPTEFPQLLNQQQITQSTHRTTTIVEPEFELPPTRIIYNNTIEPSQITAFQKGWKVARNYTGKPYDILYDKARFFISFCRRLSIQEDQYHAVFPDILSDRAEEFYLNYIGPGKRWDEIYQLLDNHFNTNINHAQYWTDWTTTSFVRARRENPDKTLPEILETVLDKLQLVQRALGEGYQGEINLHTAVVRACRGIPELDLALMVQKPTCEALFADLRASLQVAIDKQPNEQSIVPYRTYYTDRKYYNNNRPRADNRRFIADRTPRRRYDNTSIKPRTFATRKRFICKREGCWSTNHSQEERDRLRRQYLQACETLDYGTAEFEQFLTSYEGEKSDMSDDDSWNSEGDFQEPIAQYLQNSAYIHRTTGEDLYRACQTQPADQFILENQYISMYQGELWDTGAAQVSTVGKCQVEAYLRENPRAKVDWTPGSVEIRFGGGNSITSIGTIRMDNELGHITYHILETKTPFLLCLHDADRLEAYFNNVSNTIVRKDGKTIPVIRKWGHPFFNTSRLEAGAYLTELQLRRIHRRFGHPRTERLHQLLKRAGHEDVREEALQKIAKFCHHCQSHDPAPQRFKFTIKDECYFNYEVVIDIVQLQGRKALHVIDTATSFQAATFVRSISAKDTWNALCRCWIYVYQGPPDIVSHDPGTNFASEEFRNNAKIIGITCKEMPIEAHWAIGKIERAHRPLERSYDILYQEISHCTDDETILQMAIKALNDTAGPQGLVPTLLVFGTYPRINSNSPPSPEITKRAEAARKAMKLLQGIRAEVDINRAINTRNGPDTSKTLDLPLQSEVLVWREGKGRNWEGPYKIQSHDNANIIVETINGPKTYRTTQVKPYYRDENTQVDDQAKPPESTPQKRRGRPRKTAIQEKPPEVPKRRPGRPRKNPIPEETPPQRERPKRAVARAYLVQKEADNLALALKLREEGAITSPGQPFEESDKKEIDTLLAQNVLEIILIEPHEQGDQRIWKTRMVREIKGKTTTLYEKSRLVVQGYGDDEKKDILTQAPTI